MDKQIEVCTLMGCKNPKLRPHHHHTLHGHLTLWPCQCKDGGRPGTTEPTFFERVHEIDEILRVANKKEE